MAGFGKRCVLTILAVWMASLEPGFAHGETEWLPTGTLFPRAIADPHEPRFGLTYAPDPDFLDAAVGAPIPIVSFPVWGQPLLLALEASVFLRLGREGAFYPLQTVDGWFGLNVETRYRAVSGRLRLFHESAHRADGDSTVAFPGETFSKEVWRLEGAWMIDGLSLAVRVGSAWHAVPEMKGMEVGLDATWRGGGSGGRPLASLHLDADAQREWRFSKSLLLGWEAGDQRRFFLGLRLQDGFVPQGQYWHVVEEFAGIELQFSP